MSLGLIPIFQPEGAASFSELGEALAENLEELEELALDENLSPLTAFSDQREVPEDFDGSPEELEERLGPCNDWFDPAEGAKAAAALAEHLRSHGFDDIDDVDAVLEELTALTECLEAAAAKKARFRLTLS